MVLQRGSTTVVINDVPALLCENCGEDDVDEHVAETVLSAAEASARAAVRVKIRDLCEGPPALEDEGPEDAGQPAGALGARRRDRRGAGARAVQGAGNGFPPEINAQVAASRPLGNSQENLKTVGIEENPLMRHVTHPCVT